VAFLSEHSRDSARAAGLLVPGTPNAIVYCGVDAVDAELDSTPPAGLTEDDQGFLLCLGAAYLHKNRRLALELWAELRRRGSGRRLVLVGPAPPHGNSLALEAEFLLDHPELRPDVVCVGAAGESEKRWLYEHAGLVLYLSTTEGFGLVPFEAAACGVPVVTTRQGSLDEVLPAGIAVLERFDVQAGADLAEKLLWEQSAGEELCASIRRAGEAFTWDRTAEALMALFVEALRRPRRRVLAIEGEAGEPLGLRSRVQREQADHGVSGDLERFVRFVMTHPRLKDSLSPEGSRRQRAARQLIGNARRYLR
jgi:glycosyltransferase involved in cell wall biosynthesis